MKERIAKSIFWIVWTRGGIQLVSVISTATIARLLNPSDYGVMALAGIWTGTITMVTDMGLGPAVVQFPNLKKGELNACFCVALATALTGYLALFAAAPFIADWFDTPLLSRVLRIAGLSLPLVGLRTIPDSLLRKQLAFDKLSKADIGATLVAISTMLFLAWSGAGIWTLVVGGLTQTTVATVILYQFVDWRPSLTFNGDRLSQVLRFSSTSMGARVSWSFFDQIDKIILGKHSGDVVLGFYSMARFIAAMPVERVSVLVNSVAFPVMAEIQQDTDAMRRHFLRAMRLLACVTFPVCIGLGVIAEDAVQLVLSAKWLPSVPLIRVLCIHALFHSLAVMFPPVLFARYRASYVTWWTLALIAVMPFAFWGGAIQFGAYGVALAWVLCYPVFVVFLARKTLHQLEIPWAAVWLQLQPVVSATVAMTMAVVLVEAGMTADSFASRLIRLIVVTSVGALVYVTWLHWRKAPVFREIVEVLKWVTGRIPAMPVAR